MNVEVVDGDLLDQQVDVIVNAWNRNIIPWWLLIPQGVSGAIKRRAGISPFRELGRVGALPLGRAVLTGAGRLPLRGIIHVAGINLLWRASEKSIRESVANAIAIAREHDFASVAFPIIGSGSGGFSQHRALRLMCETLASLDYAGRVVIVRHSRRPIRRGLES
jgi:O-acetyl-ADP-ribose deacetylase (regulator of RNase III)